MDNFQIYEGKNEYVTTFFYPRTKSWDTERVRAKFSIDDADVDADANANAILITSVA